MRRHPNAAVAGTSGAGLGTLLVYLLGKAGVDVEPAAASAIAGGVAALALFIGRNGIRGAIRLLWRGRTTA